MNNQYAVIGWPLGYSLSPVLHNTFFKKEGIEATYTSVPLTPEELESWVRTRAFDGFNVTVPYKESIIPFLDELTDSARDIGAVNTVKNVNGELIGTNTDAPGFTMMLREDLGLSMDGASILLLGAGGAAKAIMREALNKNATLFFVDIDTQKATALKEHYIDKFTEGGSRVVIMDTPNIPDILGQVDLVINATPVGMDATQDKSILLSEALSLLKPDTSVVDIIYVPAETRLLRLARERGLPTCNGLGMLVGQGILAQQFWFNKSLGYAEAKSTLLSGIPMTS